LVLYRKHIGVRGFVHGVERGMKEEQKLTAIGEHISLTSDRAENIEIVDIVMFLPDPYKRVVLSDFEGYGDSTALPGRKMSDEELSDYGDPLPGFAVVGWRGCNLKVGQIFGVHLRLPRERH
jgi:hypothetical protein